MNRLFPEYDIWTQFVTDMYTQALDLDALKNSHPIEVEVGHPSEVDEIFDEISYNKGASVIRMLHHYIGDDDFRKGMNIYLTRHQYKNTVTEDLWAALEEASSKPVGAVMTSWIKKMGFPVVTVSSVQNGNKRTLTLTQEKFTADGSVAAESDFWMIPITISTSKQPAEIKHRTVLDSKTMEIELDDVTESDWVKINPGTVGYYRTRYSSEMLDQLIPAVRNQTLPPLDRLGLLDDMFALVQAGRASTAEFLKLIDSYRNETNYTVWSSISQALFKLQILLSHTNLIEQFNQFSISLYKPVADSLTWDAQPNESHLNTLLRSLVLNRLVSCSCAEVLQESRIRFDLHVAGKVLLPADIRNACYKAVLQVANEKTYEDMLHLYRATDLHEERDRISRSLGAIADENILRKVIEFAMSVSFDSIGLRMPVNGRVFANCKFLFLVLFVGRGSFTGLGLCDRIGFYESQRTQFDMGIFQIQLGRAPTTLSGNVEDAVFPRIEIIFFFVIFSLPGRFPAGPTDQIFDRKFRQRREGRGNRKFLQRARTAGNGTNRLAIR